MKKFISQILLITIILNGYSQSDNLGVVIEHEKLLDIDYVVYDPPLRINQVQNQSEIDYSKIEGLLQSFYSASNMDWALSDYLDKEAETARDEEHFEAVKNTDVEKNYIQMETIYKFQYNSRQFAYIKYSFIMDGVPFPVIGMMSAEKYKNRWYISNLLNQNSVITILSNLEVSVLNDIFNGKSNDSDISEIINKTKGYSGFFDFYIMYKIYDDLMAKKEIKNKLKDKRLIIRDYEFRNATLNSTSTTDKYKVSHPFILEYAIFSKYQSNNQNLVIDEKNRKRYENKPELLLLGNTPIDLIHKFSFVEGDIKYHIIKYKDDVSKIATIEEKNGTYSILKSGKYDLWEKLFISIKSDVFIQLFSKQISDKNLIEMVDYNKGSSGGVNIDVLARYIENNKASLSEYIE